MISLTNSRFFLPVCLCLSLLGCGDSSGSGAGGSGATGGSGGDGGGSAGRTESWAVQTVVQTPDGRTAFVQLVDSPGTEPLDISLAREVSGNGRLYLLDGVAYLGNPEALTIVRTRPGALTLEDDSERLSFSATGIAFLPSFAVYLSEDEALLLDAAGGTGFGWSPSEMTLGRTIDLSPVRREGFEPTIESAAVRDGKIYFVVQQTNAFGLDAFEGMLLGIIDIESGTVSDVIEDLRCIGTRGALNLAEDGTIYVLADNYGATGAFGPDAPPTCMLRILPGEDLFDPDWLLEMPDLLGGRQATSFIYVGDGLGYASVIYDDEITISLDEDPVGYFSQPASRWWLIDLDAEIGTEVAGLPFHSLAGGNGTVSDGRVFLFTPTDRFEGTSEVWEPDLSDPAGEPTMVYDTNGAVPVLGRIND